MSDKQRLERIRAAAPELLEALKAIRSLFDNPIRFIVKKVSGPITNGDQDLIDAAFIKADDAISKAERGQ